MLDGKRIVVVMPAYNAAATLERTWREVMAQGVVDAVVVVDDGSRDETVAIARTLPHTLLHVHERNRGYGANQKTCYRLALEQGADVAIMVHPDYQYTPALIPSMAQLIVSGRCDCVLGSRILGGRALEGGMPLWKFAANRVLTTLGNLAFGARLSEHHTGYRAFSRRLLEQIDVSRNSEDFVFDNQMLAQILWRRFVVLEVACPTKYFPEASSIGFARSLRYGLGCLAVFAQFVFARAGWRGSRLFPPHAR